MKNSIVRIPDASIPNGSTGPHATCNYATFHHGDHQSRVDPLDIKLLPPTRSKSQLNHLAINESEVRKFVRDNVLLVFSGIRQKIMLEMLFQKTFIRVLATM